MKGQVHLLDSDEALTEGRDYVANCQKQIAKAAFVFMWNERLKVEKLHLDMIDSAVSSFRVCTRCLNLELERRYVYGLICGEEIKHPEAA